MKLNLAEAKQKIQNVTAYTEKLRANYQNANAVFAVDQVQLKHGGNAFDLKLEDVLELRSFGIGNQTVQGIGGTQCVLQFSGKGIECAPGDLIVRR